MHEWSLSYLCTVEQSSYKCHLLGNNVKTKTYKSKLWLEIRPKGQTGVMLTFLKCVISHCLSMHNWCIYLLVNEWVKKKPRRKRLFLLKSEWMVSMCKCVNGGDAAVWSYSRPENLLQLENLLDVIDLLFPWALRRAFISLGHGIRWVRKEITWPCY